MLLLGLITLLAATVNGALGYGFSSITVPLGVALGVPLGGQIIRRLRPETFRRICMSFDAWVVAFGLSKVIRDVKLIDGNAAYLVLAAVIIIDAFLLYRFFSVHRVLEPAGSAGFSAPEVAKQTSTVPYP